MNIKRFLTVISLGLSLTLFAGCDVNLEDGNGADNGQVDEGDTNGSEGDLEVGSVEDYYPIEKNTKYLYSGDGSEYASYDKYVDYISRDGKTVQYREQSPGTTMAKVVEVKDGRVTQLYSRGEAYYRENYISNPILRRADEMEKNILLKEPIELGNSWTLEDGRVRTISAVDEKVATASGEYTAIEVTTEGDEYVSKDYYGKDTGHIKSVFQSGDGFEVVSELGQVERDVAYRDEINLYYPDLDRDTYYYKSTPVDFRTNDITRVVLRDKYRKRPEGHDLGAVLTPNTSINYLFLNAKNHVYIDLSEDFLREINAGAYYETMLLNSIALTFGDYYNQANRLYLSIDGGDYESGHIFMEKGDYMEVDYENRSKIE